MALMQDKIVYFKWVHKKKKQFAEICQYFNISGKTALP